MWHGTTLSKMVRAVRLSRNIGSYDWLHWQNNLTQIEFEIEKLKDEWHNLPDRSYRCCEDKNSKRASLNFLEAQKDSIKKLLKDDQTNKKDF